MRSLRRASDALFVVAVLLLVIAVVRALTALAVLAVVLLLVSVALTVAKRRVFRRSQT